MRKVKYLFARSDLDGAEVDPAVILKRCMAWLFRHCTKLD